MTDTIPHRGRGEAQAPFALGQPQHGRHRATAGGSALGDLLDDVRRESRWTLALLVVFAAAAAGIYAAYRTARRTNNYDYAIVFWVSLLVAIVFVLGMIFRRDTTRTQHVLALLGLGLLMYFPKYLMSENGPIYFDEYGHYRHALDISASGHAIVANSYIPTIKYYPGLEVATAGLHKISGLSIWHSGQLITLVAHCAMLAIVYTMALTIGLPPRFCAVATVVYATNPSYMYFDTQFAYESLGIAFAFGAMLACLKIRRGSTVRACVAWCGAAVVSIAACVVTHHVSSAVMCICLLTIVVFVPILSADARVRQVAVIASVGSAAFGTAAVVLWSTLVDPHVVGYIWPHIDSAMAQLLQRLHLSATASGTAIAGSPGISHQPFAGSSVSAYERAAAYLGPVAVAAFVVSAYILGFRRRRTGNFGLAAPFLLLAAVYVVSLPLALTSSGGEPVHRSWAFTYVGVAIVVGIAASSFPQRSKAPGLYRYRQLAVGALVMAICVIEVGNVASGSNLSYRFPGPTVFESDTHSGTAQLRSMLAWVNRNLPGGGVVSDRSTSEYLEAYTKLLPPGPADAGVFSIYYEGSTPSAVLRNELRTRGFEYFVLDRRFETQTPIGHPFPGYTPLDPAATRSLINLASTGFATSIFDADGYIIFKLRP
jgi:hypothetical protein